MGEILGRDMGRKLEMGRYLGVGRYSERLVKKWNYCFGGYYWKIESVWMFERIVRNMRGVRWNWDESGDTRRIFCSG